MANLQPGDLCEILDGHIQSIYKSAVGKTVILICVTPPDPFWTGPESYEPFWRCAGLPNDWEVSHISLRKIPPPRLEDETETNIGATRHHELPYKETSNA